MSTLPCGFVAFDSFLALLFFLEDKASMIMTREKQNSHKNAHVAMEIIPNFYFLVQIPNENMDGVVLKLNMMKCKYENFVLNKTKHSVMVDTYMHGLPLTGC